MGRTWTLVVIASTLAGLGCQSRQGTTDSAASTGETGEDGEACQPFELCDECWPPELPPHSLDIMVVVDGSIGSAGAQTRLAAGLEQLITELDANEHGLDYRIGITTTDMGLPPCDPLVTTPEHGTFIASSCRERLSEFVDADGQDFTSTCTDVCSLESIERVPTQVVQEAELAPRAWIERDGETTNLAADVDLLEALRCTAMVGVSGCRFESPLAALEAAYAGSHTPGHPNFGFFRPHSKWAFVIISDADDCSVTETGLGIFDPDGLRTFWSDPTADAPTPAACWNAATECSGGNEEYTCDLASYGLDGLPTGFPNAIVMFHPDGFAETLKSSDYWTSDVLLFTGLTLDGTIDFNLAQDPDYALEHGIGPGCDDQAGTLALPPVRMWRFLRRFRTYGEREQFLMESAESICAPDFGPSIAALGQRLRESVDRPNCYFSGPCDADPSTQVLDVECDLSAYDWLTNESFGIPECARGEDGAYLVDPDTGRAAMPDAQTDLCYVARVDAQQLTPDPLDDLVPACNDPELGIDRPLEFDLVSPDGRLPDVYVQALCNE